MLQVIKIIRDGELGEVCCGCCYYDILLELSEKAGELMGIQEVFERICSVTVSFSQKLS